MKYFRSYPWGMQLLLFLLMIITMIGFGSFMMLTLLPKFTPYTLTQIGTIREGSPLSLISAGMIVQGITSLFVFLFPAGLFAYLAHPRPAEYMGFKAPSGAMHLVLVIFIMLGAMPVLQFIQNLVGHIDFGAKVKAEQAANDSMFAAFLTMPDTASFIRAFLVLAIVPAIGEEMFFRGVLMRFARKRSRTMVFPIVFTSAIFAFSHTNIYGYLSIFLAGALLAIIYNLTGSLWCNIVAHLFFNGFQVILVYASSSSKTIKAVAESNSIPVVYVIAGSVIFAVSFYMLYRSRTPLPYSWTNDFGPDEKKDDDWDFLTKK